ncbi:type II toxin-antitoxin system VapC family toxin [Conexibacter sp. CPCC 206217]|uniref:type II toxin-antitoxin system VapC family toxin n=1 Tax=Conexibacter sp. CPCC 206217 TaxID=3064574 RepID=UPI00272830F6|nr:type II toxin-antitoxin system VapC family toxin [Conexibacter sp. CPCC 206217]MDO8211319.1 type II toxin-antitoxin system VapC family toxin [Conexibacter sp. CPCC 206217]
MSVLLLDSGVWLAACDPDDRYHRAAAEIVALGEDEPELAALDLTLFEVGNVAIRRWRSVSRAREVTQLVEIAAAGNLERVDGETVCATIADADTHGLSSYDAAYVTVARRRGWMLVSCDHRDLVRPGLAVTPTDVVKRDAVLG